MIGPYLRELRKEKGISQYALAKELNLGRSTITQYETGDRMPDYGTLLNIAHYFSVSTDYLLGNSKVRKIQGFIPLITFDEDYIPSDHLHIFQDPASAYQPDELFYYLVPDDNMIGARIMKGDIALVKKQDQVENGDIALVSVKNEKAALKRVYKSPDHYILHMDHPHYQPTFINLQDVEIIGKVIEVRFKL
ncbi:hypothetical protein DCMF_06940 [Candidatus Formimonas warabiya]|uniref:HTH cro/C1-type domain-containing protein n=2 Tax=Formimonas warabiya TaxID=1761012 RepID=A0A3G1KPZ8_FORW1|nr:hypothetical protein DCMF_06940 [Candidatus Formimonas warabiya]